MSSADAAYRRRYVEGLAALWGVPAARLGVTGSSVAPVAARRGQRLVSLYRVGPHSVLVTDPDLSDRFDSWHGRPGVVAFEEFEALASAHGATRLGRGFDHVPATGWSAPERPAAVVDLDSSAPATIGLVGALLEDCPPADRDEAEFDLAALDPVLVGWVAGGRLTAVAGGRPEPARPGCHDIGVIVHPAGRRGGRGQAVVAAVTERLVAAGELPLYRYGATNAGSGRLCRAVGFEMVAELEAFEWPAPGGADS